jgi:hypothetical protein
LGVVVGDQYGDLAKVHEVGVQGDITAHEIAIYLQGEQCAEW